jgi:hypothetical protein
VTFDPIENPSHYSEGRKHEPIDVIEDWGLGFHLGNALKYISRAGRKTDELEDLAKAIWYIEREIDLKRELSKAKINDKDLVDEASYYCSSSGQRYLQEYGNGFDDPLR